MNFFLDLLDHLSDFFLFLKFQNYAFHEMVSLIKHILN